MSLRAWRSVLAYALLLAAGVLVVLALCRCDPAPTPDAGASPIQATPTTVVIWHQDPDGKIRWGRLATCWGPVCQPGPTVTP